MPRSFLITKLHKWKSSCNEDDAAESHLVSDVGVRSTDMCCERLPGEDQVLLVQNISEERKDDVAAVDSFAGLIGAC